MCDIKPICPISLEEINVPCTLQCGHTFENDKIKEWLSKENSCPLCRNFCDEISNCATILELFFSSLSESKAKFIADILENKSQISRRFVNCVIENYVKTNSHVGQRYKSYLMLHRKRNFDIFSRHGQKKICIDINNRTITTTTAQLNYFKWLMENNLDEFVIKSHEEKY